MSSRKTVSTTNWAVGDERGQLVVELDETKLARLAGKAKRAKGGVVSIQYGAFTLRWVPDGAPGG